MDDNDNSYLNFSPGDFSFMDRTIHRDTLKWKSKCIYKIPREWIYPIIKSLYPSLMVDSYAHISTEHIWKDVYKSFINWTNIINHDELYFKKVIDFTKLSLMKINRVLSDYLNKRPKKIRITCTAVIKKYLAIGTQTGIVIVYDIQNLKERICEFVHGGEIRKVLFWQSATGDINIIAISYFEAKFWDLITRNELMYFGSVSCICTGTMNNLLVEANGSISDCIRNHSMVHETSKIELPLLTHELIVSIHSVQQTMIVLSRYIANSRIFHLTIPTEKNSFQIKHISDFSTLPISSIETNFGNVYLPTDKLGIGFFDKTINFLNVKQNRWIRRDNLAFAGVTSVIMHANIFILGLETGGLRIIALRTTSDSGSDKTPVKEMQLGRDPIISLCVTDIDSRPYIIASSAKKVYEINS